MLFREVGEQRHGNWPMTLSNIAAAVSFAWFLYDGVARVWSSSPSDFANYYTAARLTAEHVPLRNFYDYPEFQRQIGSAGVGRQLGGYIPQTPLAMAPFIPLSYLAPTTAQRAWAILNVGFLGLALWLLSRITRFDILHLWLAVCLAYGALRQNFLLGQYYILLFAILTIAVYALVRQREETAGAALATAFFLKLYGAPFLLFLAARRMSRAAIWMIAVSLIAMLFAIALFGWEGVTAYASNILPRSLAGETLNPFHPGNGTFATALKRLLVAEPGLNPHPLVDSPAAFSFLQCTFTVMILLLPAIAARNRYGPLTKSEIAWWIIAMLVVSPNTASYTFVLLALPVVLLLDEMPVREWAYLLVPYFFLALPLRPPWSLFFPKVWLLLFLFVRVASRQLRSIGFRTAGLAFAGTVIMGTAAAIVAAKFPETPAPVATVIATSPGAIYSSAPVITAIGIFYESITEERYAIEHWNAGKFETFVLMDHAFHPTAPDSGARVYFETSTGAGSSIGFFDMRDRRFGVVPIDRPEPRDPAVSHDGRLLAFVSRGELYLYNGRSCRRLTSLASARQPAFLPGDTGLVYVAVESHQWRIVQTDLEAAENYVLIKRQMELANPSISPDGTKLAYSLRNSGKWQISIQEFKNNQDIQVTNGRCNSWAPAWSLNSKELIFASDCKRGVNLPALWSVPLSARGGTPLDRPAATSSRKSHTSR